MTEIIPKKHTIKWLHIALSHKTQELKRIADEISVLNHQVENFDNMPENTQICVIRELNDILNGYAEDNNQSINWDYKISEE